MSHHVRSVSDNLSSLWLSSRSARHGKRALKLEQHKTPILMTLQVYQYTVTD